MGRKKKVDRDTALRAALRAFWTNGYSGLGVRQLEELSGINRFAVQTEYGGKEGLFLDIAALYSAHWQHTEGDTLRGGNLNELVDFFMRRTRKGGSDELNSGCLLLNTLAGDRPGSEQFGELVAEFLENIESSFASAIRNERMQGTLASRIDIKASSQMLLNTLIGINFSIKQQRASEVARPTAIALRSVILSWRES